MKKKSEIIKSLLGSTEVEKGEVSIVFNVDKNDDFRVGYSGNKKNIVCMLATIIHGGMKPNADKEKEIIAKCIVDAVGLVLSIPDKAGLGIAIKMDEFMSEAVKNAQKGILSLDEKINSVIERDFSPSNDDDEEEEDCATCNANKVCPLPQAIQYRKENGIPTPDYARKTRKKRSCRKSNEEKSN